MIVFDSNGAAVNSLLLALVIRSGGFVEVAGVLHDDGVTWFGLVDPVAGRDDLFGDAHDCQKVNECVQTIRKRMSGGEEVR